MAAPSGYLILDQMTPPNTTLVSLFWLLFLSLPCWFDRDVAEEPAVGDGRLCSIASHVLFHDDRSQLSQRRLSMLMPKKTLPTPAIGFTQ